jgi:hypothetical protein
MVCTITSSKEHTPKPPSFVGRQTRLQGSHLNKEDFVDSFLDRINVPTILYFLGKAINLRELFMTFQRRQDPQKASKKNERKVSTPLDGITSTSDAK